MPRGDGKMKTMSAAPTILMSASSQSVPIPEPQTRGYYLNIDMSLTPEALEQEIDRVARAGFNLLIYPIFSNGWTLFPSESQRTNRLPSIHPLFKQWNPLELVTSLAAAANLSVWGLARAYNFHPRHAITKHTLLHKNPRWRMVRHPAFFDSVPRSHENWYPCPLQHGEKGRRTYRHALAEILVEAVSGYPLDGIVLDCTGFGLAGGALGESPFCFCENCKARYFERFGSVLSEDARGPKLTQVRAWQREQAEEHLSYLRHRLLRTRRTLRMLCLASPHWREHHDYQPERDGGALLDWPTLLADGELEEVLIDHDSETISPAFGSNMASDFAYLGDQVLYMPLLSVKHPGELRLPLAALARYTVPGFIADFHQPLSEAFMIELGSTVFAEPAPLPEAEPVRAAMFFLERVRQAHESRPKLHDLMSDFLRLLARQFPDPRDFNTLLVIEQNIHGLEQFIRRGYLKSERIPETTLRHLGLARRFVRMALMDVRS
jgi:hypothetical protein